MRLVIGKCEKWCCLFKNFGFANRCTNLGQAIGFSYTLVKEEFYNAIESLL